MDVLEKRVTNLEEVLASFIKSSDESHRRTEKELSVMSKNVSHLSQEMLNFKNEMSGFKIEMKDFKTNIEADTQKLKESLDKNTKDMNKKWGELANKMGTLIEDLVLPAARPVLQKYFSEPLIFLGSKINKKDSAQNLQGEFDIVATSSTKVFLIEVKSTPNSDYLKEMPLQIEKLVKLFPEYAHLTPVLIIASINIHGKVLAEATKNGIYSMIYREWEFMDIINFNEITPKI